MDSVLVVRLGSGNLEPVEGSRRTDCGIERRQRDNVVAGKSADILNQNVTASFPQIQAVLVPRL